MAKPEYLKVIKGAKIISDGNEVAQNIENSKNLWKICICWIHTYRITIAKKYIISSIGSELGNKIALLPKEQFRLPDAKYIPSTCLYFEHDRNQMTAGIWQLA